MTAPYFRYQMEGFRWLFPKRTALLADEMGLGKSVQALLAAQEVAPFGPWLIVCPAIVRVHWYREIIQWCRIPPVPITVPTTLSDPIGNITVCSYEYATRNAEKLAAREWEVCVFDEAHMLKNRRAKRTRALIGKLSPQAKRLWFLTGTPAPNHPGELYVYAQAAGVVDMDEELFCSTYTYGAWSGDRWTALATREDKMAQLRATMAPMMLRREKREVMKDLPEISRHLVPLPLPRPDFSRMDAGEWAGRLTELREKLHDEAMQVREWLEKLDDATGAYETLAGIAQFVPTLRRFLALQKVKPALEYINDELEQYGYRKKLVLFVAHTEAGRWYHEELNKLTKGGCVWVYGGVTGLPRQAAIDRFNSDPSCCVFLGNVTACGAGINLAVGGCSDVIHLDREWSPHWGEQGDARVHRPPQKLPVTVRDFYFPDTLDEAIINVLARKRKMVSSIWKKDVALFA